MNDENGLKYVGDAAIIGVPARDLTAEEVNKFGRKMLLASKLYVEFKKAFTPKPQKAAWKGVTADKE